MVEKKKVVQRKPRKTVARAPQRQGKETAASAETASRKQMKKALPQSKDKYRSIVETSLDGIYQVDTSGKFLFVNESFARTFGYKREEIIDKHFSSLLSAEAVPTIEKTVKKVLSGKSMKNEALLRHRDGHEVPVSFTATPLKEQGRIVGLTGILRDITRLKQVEQELAESEEWHRALVETAGKAGYGITILQNTPEQEAAVIFANSEATRILGFSQEEVLGMSAWDFFEPSELAEMQQRYKQRQKGQQVISHYEAALLHKDGIRIPVEASLSLMKYQGKAATVIHFKDISERKRVEKELNRHRNQLEELVDERTTALKKVNEQLHQENAERKQAEVALQQSEKLSRSLIENAMDAIVILNEDLSVRYESPSFERILGYGLEERAGKNALELVHPDDVPRASDAIARSRQDPDHVPRFEIRALHKDGSWHHLEAISKNLIDDPIVKGIVVNVRDITERKQAEETIRESEERYKALVENAYDVINVIRRDGTIAYRSPARAYVADLKLEDYVGMSGFEWVHPDDMSKCMNVFAELMEKPGAVVRVELRTKYIDDSWHTVEANASNLLDNKAVKGIVVHWHDITERKQAEEKLQELYQQEMMLRQQLETEIKKRMEFTRALAHELKTPLTPMLISSQVLASELQDGPLLSLARNINKGAQNLNSRIDELLDMAKGEIGLLQLKPQTLDMLPLLREVAEYVSPVASSRNQSLVLELPDSLPLLKADKVRIRQVLLNLLNNAFKFTPEGGKITLRATNQNDSLVVEVEDNGPGLDLKKQQHLFEPYHPMEVDEEHLSSLGLGLALCKTLVQLHGGQIWAKSQPGKGSNFSFSLPLEATNNKRRVPESGESL